MVTISKYEPGQFSWVDLMSLEAAAAKQFYGDLFGWTPVDMQDDTGGTYTQFHLRDKPVAGLGEMSAEMKETGMPAVWNSYVTVEDADACAARATEIGGAVQMPVMQITDAGRMAILADPTGARLSIWEPGSHLGAGFVNEPGSFAWNELATTDLEAARAFYQKLFGWTYEGGDGENPYLEIQNRGRSNGGIRPIGADDGPAPPHWGVYFAVEDCDASRDRAASLGAQVIVPGVDIAQGRFAVLADPQGAVFTVMRVDQPDA